jgi:hypothetical protein
VCFIDLKLAGEAEGNVPATEQIRAAGQTGRSLGGLNTRSVMVRPNWDEDSDLRAFASAHQVVLLDRSDAAALFRKLAGLIGGTMDDNLREAEQLLSRARREKGFVIAHARTGEREVARHAERSVFDPTESVTARCRQQKPNWSFLALGAFYFLWVSEDEPSVGGSCPAQKFDYGIWNFAEYWRSKSGRTHCFFWKSLCEQRKTALLKALKSWRGKRISVGL